MRLARREYPVGRCFSSRSGLDTRADDRRGSRLGEKVSRSGAVRFEADRETKRPWKSGGAADHSGVGVVSMTADDPGVVIRRAFQSTMAVIEACELKSFLYSSVWRGLGRILLQLHRAVQGHHP